MISRERPPCLRICATNLSLLFFKVLFSFTQLVFLHWQYLLSNNALSVTPHFYCFYLSFLIFTYSPCSHMNIATLHTYAFRKHFSILYKHFLYNLCYWLLDIFHNKFFIYLYYSALYRVLPCTNLLFKLTVHMYFWHSFRSTN